jgi:5-formyltetrahydrofolate cyclo-ligase
MTIATYLPLKSEVDLSRLLRLGASVQMFRRSSHTAKLRVELSSSHIERYASRRALAAQQQPTEAADLVSPSAIDLFLVPAGSL